MGSYKSQRGLIMKKLVCFSSLTYFFKEDVGDINNENSFPVVESQLTKSKSFSKLKTRDDRDEINRLMMEVF
jgi:hypothetical protein